MRPGCAPHSRASARFTAGITTELASPRDRGMPGSSLPKRAPCRIDYGGVNDSCDHQAHRGTARMGDSNCCGTRPNPAKVEPVGDRLVAPEGPGPDALWMADMTSGSDGQSFACDERLAELVV